MDRGDARAKDLKILINNYLCLEKHMSIRNNRLTEKSGSYIVKF